jgi:hypothetical protein
MTRGAWVLVLAMLAFTGCGTSRRTKAPSEPTPTFQEVSIRDLFPTQRERQAYVRGYKTCYAFAKAGDYTAVSDYVMKRRLAPDGTVAGAEGYACVDAYTGPPLRGSGISTRPYDQEHP